VSYSSWFVDKWQNNRGRSFLFYKNLMLLTPAILEWRYQLHSIHYLEVNRPLPLNTVFSYFCIMNASDLVWFSGLSCRLRLILKMCLLLSEVWHVCPKYWIDFSKWWKYYTKFLCPFSLQFCSGRESLLEPTKMACKAELKVMIFVKFNSYNQTFVSC
jgi:hypothetical protein